MHASNSESPRAGEPLRVRLVELSAGSCWTLGTVPGGVQRDWLVMWGRLRAHGDAWSAYDYRVEPSGSGRWTEISAETDALVYVREAILESQQHPRVHVSRAADACREDYALGIPRRMLWRHGSQGAFLFDALPGVSVPAHCHRHDEECLMLEGELFIDDELLRAGEYQIAPAGTAHRSVMTDTGVLIYAHGDVDLDVSTS